MSERLTLKKEIGQYLPMDHSREQRIWNKLGGLEDIEETFGYGLDLETILKAGTNGIWVVCSQDCKLLQCHDVLIDFPMRRFVDIDMGSVFPFYEYGQTYALTQGELRGNPDAYCQKFPKPQWGKYGKFLKEAEERFKGGK